MGSTDRAADGDGPAILQPEVDVASMMNEGDTNDQPVTNNWHSQGALPLPILHEDSYCVLIGSISAVMLNLKAMCFVVVLLCLSIDGRCKFFRMCTRRTGALLRTTAKVSQHTIAHSVMTGRTVLCLRLV